MQKECLPSRNAINDTCLSGTSKLWKLVVLVENVSFVSFHPSHGGKSRNKCEVRNDNCEVQQLNGSRWP